MAYNAARLFPPDFLFRSRRFMQTFADQLTEQYARRQRTALAELIDLAEAAASGEQEMAAAHGAARAAADRRLKRAQERLTRRAEKQTAGARAAWEARSTESQAGFAAKLESLREERGTLAQRIAAEAESARGKAKSRYEQAVWLADSVLEAANNKLAGDKKRTIEQVDAERQLLDGLEEKLAKLLRRLRHPDLPRPETAAEEETQSDDPHADFKQFRDEAEATLERMRSLLVPSLLVSWRPYVAAALFTALAAVGTQLAFGGDEPNIPALFGAILGGVGLSFATFLFLKWMGGRQIAHLHEPLWQKLDAARAATERELTKAAEQRRVEREAAVEKRATELEAAQERYTPRLEEIEASAKDTLATHEARLDEQIASLEAEANRAREGEAQEEYERLRQLEVRYETCQTQARQRHERELAEADAAHDRAREELEQRWAKAAQTAGELTGSAQQLARSQFPAWSDDEAWAAWTPPKQFSGLVQVGQLEVDLAQAVRERSAEAPIDRLPAAMHLPALLSAPDRLSLLLQAGHDGREQAIGTVEATMLRLLTTLPPGRERFTLIDPVGLGESFAAFMHLADFDEDLVGGRIWTDAEQINQRLADLTDHMETVIQKYLRNEFETIEQYNAQAGELAEPYRFLVVADFPTGFSEDALQRLLSIIRSGPRCGVYTIIHRDTRQRVAKSVMQELEAGSVSVVHRDGRWQHRDEVYAPFPLTMEQPPSEAMLTDLLQRVGAQAKEAKRVEVSFAAVAPPDNEPWTATCNDELRVPMGRTGATRLQALSFGKGVAQHGLIAGKTGSGKSTLLHVVITNLAMWYPPSEVEFYLIDFKKGVEFKTYATHQLPHARAIAIESDREFGLSVLQRIDEEMTRRGELYRKLGVQDLAAYRRQSGEAMPRTLLLIDEFQEFFNEDDKVAQDAALLLDRLVRQGRAFGIHLLLGSQTLGGGSGLPRSTMGQMAVRIALQCGEADSQLILSDNNAAARLLSRPGEAIYNDAGGLVEGNSPFQVAWLDDDHRDELLRGVIRLAEERGVDYEPPLIFEGNSPAHLDRNTQLARLLDASGVPKRQPRRVAYLGAPVSIKSPTHVGLRNQTGANVLMVGQQEEAAMAIFASMMVSLAAQHAADDAKFVVFDGTPADSPLFGYFTKLAEILPQSVELVAYRDVDAAMSQLTEECSRRQEDESLAAKPIYTFVFGLQRYRALRKSEDDFSFSLDGDDKPAAADKQFVELLREGAALGMHVIAWCDTPIAVDRTFDRTSMREFDHRILFQMSATDSSNLIDSPAANQLGFHRALAYSEEKGTLEKFRPYGLPDEAWLKQVAATLKARPGA